MGLIVHAPQPDTQQLGLFSSSGHRAGCLPADSVGESRVGTIAPFGV